MKRVVVGLVLWTVLSLGVGLGEACTFLWDPVTTSTTGTPMSGIKYRVYLQAAGATVVQTIADTDQVTVTLPCPAGTYWVTAYTTGMVESDKSLPVILEQAGKPVNLKWTK